MIFSILYIAVCRNYLSQSLSVR